MCDRYTLHSPAELLRARFGVPLEDAEVTPRYNICPSQNVLAVAVGGDGERKRVHMRWGWIPHGSQTPTTTLSTIHTRLEAAPSSPLYRGAYARRRCWILADGFYEWQPAARSASGVRTPFWFARPDRAPWAFAGLYSVWRPANDPGAPPLLSCTILTMPALPAVARVHGRMPIILDPSHEDAWLDPERRHPADIAALLVPDPTALEAQPVSTGVDATHNNGPELIAPVSELRPAQSERAQHSLA
jgi:putative SOS response-associated peptidase YedK